MKISRQVGTASEILNLFVSDASVTTGAGLANVIGSSVAYAWWHNDQAAASTGTASTAGAMGIYSTSAWVQISSTAARGWYQFGTPNGVFASGRSAALYFNGAVNMAPLPVEVELTKINNQQYDSSTVFLAHTSTSPANLLQVYGSAIVTSASGQLLVSTQAIDKGGYGVTTVAANITTNANVIQAYGSAIVTSASGQFRVSTQAIDKGGYGVTTVAADVTTNANVIQTYGSAIVTSASGQFRVSTQAIDKGGYGVTTVAANITTNANVIEAYGSAIVTSASGVLNVSTQTIDKTGYSIVGTTFANVIEFYAQPAVTSAAGQLRVSTQTLTVPDNAGIAAISSQVINPMTESYRNNTSTGTMAQLMYEVISHMGEVSISNTTKTINTIGHTSASMSFQLDSSSAPRTITRIT